MPRRWYESKLIDIEKIAPRTAIFRLKLDEEEQLQWIAGQFIILDLPISEKRTKRWRSYSIANTPNPENIIELCIVHLEGGAGTQYLFEEATIGTTITFKRPQGVFTLPNSLEDCALFMICTGTGVAPFRSMLQSIVQNDLDFKKIHLIFGTRYKENILYRGEMEDLKRQYDNFHYSIALSREEDWKGNRGYVHDIYLKYCKDMAGAKYYLCGWQAMIDEAVENLKTKCNVSQEDIVYELYG